MILIKNGRVIDPANNTDEIKDIYINGGKIVEKPQSPTNAVVIDATGKWVTPGFIDLHTHLREPGFEHKETIATGTKSAAKGGFTTVCCMPNTEPVIDSEILVEYIKLKAEREGVVNVLPIGAITKGQRGEELANIGKMAEVGACAISEDGKTVKNPSLMKTAMKYASMFNLPVFAHCEETQLTGKGIFNAGKPAARLGVAGISNDSEEIIVARDILLAGSTGAKLHICHVSTEGSCRLLRFAQENGQNVTAEATPHHFSLSDEDITGFDSSYKMSPPLRSKKDVEAIKQALKDNTIAVIATDHAPHHQDDKNCELQNAANGIVGLETAFALCVTELIEPGVLTPLECIAKLTSNPAKILGMNNKGHLGIGADADITITDPTKEYTIDKETFESKGKNTPFHNKTVRGAVLYTLVSGKIVFSGKIINNKGELV